jgi:hypothetical protein
MKFLNTFDFKSFLDSLELILDQNDIIEKSPIEGAQEIR